MIATGDSRAQQDATARTASPPCRVGWWARTDGAPDFIEDRERGAGLAESTRSRARSRRHRPYQPWRKDAPSQVGARWPPSCPPGRDYRVRARTRRRGRDRPKPKAANRRVTRDLRLHRSVKTRALKSGSAEMATSKFWGLWAAVGLVDRAGGGGCVIGGRVVGSTPSWHMLGGGRADRGKEADCRLPGGLGLLEWSQITAIAGSTGDCAQRSSRQRLRRG
jgi:hypothetical protein